MDFHAFATAHGLRARHFLDDGRIHRCATAEHPHKRNGAYLFDLDFGWVQDWSAHIEPVIWRTDKPVAARTRPGVDLRERLARTQAAAEEAARIIKTCETGPHPYLARKGFADTPALIDFDGRMVVPMRHCQSGTVQSLQWIDKHGEKKFLTGGAAKLGVFALGSAHARETWLCEGYATGLSVMAALKRLCRHARVLVCFSAGNLIAVAEKTGGKRFVFADCDESGTGQNAAEKTGLPWVMPPEFGDANDWMQRAGILAVAQWVNGLR